MKLFSVLLLAISCGIISCERHEFEGPDGTKQLHQHHAADGGHAAENGHGAKHETPATPGHDDPTKKAAH